MNAFGTGIAYPFVVIYFHNVRGFSLGISGLLLAASGAAGILTGPTIGVVIDKIGGRLTLAGALVLQAIGWGSLALVHKPWQGVLAAIVAGVGNAGFWPSQSTLLAGLSPQARRHGAFALQRVTRNLGIGLGGLVGGLIATTTDATSFTVLFVVDAITFLAFVAMLALVPDPGLGEVERGARGRGYRDVFRNRLFLGIAGLNVVFVAAGYAQLELLPVFAKNEANVTERGIGFLFFLNTVVVAVAQLPVSKILEGHSRMRALATMCVLWAASWMIVFIGGASVEAAAAVVVFSFAVLLFGLGECFQGPVQGALVADLAPPLLRGRYMAISTNSWDLGFLIGPAIGGFILAAEPLALWPLAAVACLAAGAGALSLESRLPAKLRLTPA
jgi:MFS family permease